MLLLGQEKRIKMDSDKSDSVLERKVIHPGKPFIKQGEEHARAYIVQNGRIRSYIMEGTEQVEVTQYGPGRIIGEICLMSDEPMTMNYEAMEDTTVITLTRAEFQKKISKMDKNVATIFEHVMNKLNYQYAEDLNRARAGMSRDGDALKMVQVFSEKVPLARRAKYESAILPHVNAILQELKNFKKDA